jgi:hypothetical protein
MKDMDRPETLRERQPLSPLDTMRASLNDLALGRWDDLDGFLARINQEITAAERSKSERTLGP